MLEFEIYYFYWLAFCVQPLQHIEEGMTLQQILSYLVTARMAAEAFKDSNLRNEMRHTAERLTELVNLINTYIPAKPDQTLRDRYLSAFEAAQLKQSVTGLTTALQGESKHLFMICVQSQRGFSPSTLVEKIEDCFPQNTWNAIEKAAKREFGESGRCLSLERYTGSAFHALRGVEIVIRQCIIEMVGTLPAKRDWGTYIQTLKTAGADPHLTTVLDNIRTLDRNPLMHPEDWLDIDDAIGVFTISRTAITRLVDQINATRKATGLPPL